jgi:hypothetical protein
VQNFRDACATAIAFGKADFFITFTASPQWPLIHFNLARGQHYLDRPDLCVRVFDIMKKKFLHMMLEENAFGK